MSDAPALSVLVCGSCKAPVAPAIEKTRCPYCGAEVVTPPEHREALENADREVKADALAQEAFHRLGKSPSVLEQIAYVVFASGPYAVLTLVVFSFWSAAKSTTYILDRSIDWFRVNAYDWFSYEEQALFLWGSTFSLIALLLVLGVLGGRRAVAISSLQAALAAKPPAREGGPATCRECGAPLVVEKDARGVRCLYCGTDNLVALPKEWLKRAGRRASKVAREAKAALAAQRHEVRKLRIRLAVGIGFVLVLASLTGGGLLSDVLHGSGGGIFDLKSTLREKRYLFDFYQKPVGYKAAPVAPRVPLDRCAELWEVPREQMDCFFGTCDSAWFVALRADETLTLQFDHEGAVRLYEHLGSRQWTGDLPETWGTAIQAKQFKKGDRAVFRAPHTNWYRIAAKLLDDGEAAGVCATNAS